MIILPFFGMLPPSLPQHKHGDAYGRKRCKRMNNRLGHRAKLKAKNRKKRQMRNK